MFFAWNSVDSNVATMNAISVFPEGSVGRAVCTHNSCATMAGQTQSDAMDDRMLTCRVHKRMRQSELCMDGAKVENKPCIVIDDFEDVVDDEDDDNQFLAVSPHPLSSVSAALRCAFNTAAYEGALQKEKPTDKDRILLALHTVYGSVVQGDFRIPPGGAGMDVVDQDLCGLQLGVAAVSALQRQRVRIEFIKKQQSLNERACASEPGAGREPCFIPLPLLMQGPAAVAWHLVEKAGCTEEQRDAVALLALNMEHKWQSLSEPLDLQKLPLLPLRSASSVHRALWLGGSGVGKTHTLLHVVEPLAVAFYGSHGYLATARTNHACQSLGVRGRTLHNANVLSAVNSLTIAKLKLTAAQEMKLLLIRGTVGVEVIDEVGIVPPDLLHADALRSSYVRCGLHGSEIGQYMRPEETWGRVPAKILCGDFYQLTPVSPMDALLLSDPRQSYEHQQGQTLLAGIEFVVEFKQTKRSDDPLLIEVLDCMREPGGQTLSDAAWAAILKTQVGDMGTGDTAFDRASEPAAPVDTRFGDALGWHHAAYEWSIVHFSMQAEARRSAQAANRPLFLVQAVDCPSMEVAASEYEDMLVETYVLQQPLKLLGVLPVYVGMEMILTESLCPPRFTAGAPVVVTGIELHTDELPIANRESLVENGCVLLRFLPQCIYVKLKDATEDFLSGESDGISEPGYDLIGVIAVTPIARSWRFNSKRYAKPLLSRRLQIPLVPQKQSTVLGLQGRTAEPGLVAYWHFPKRLSRDTRWLLYYAILSKLHRFSSLLSLGLPDRSVIEGGPPVAIREAFQRLFEEKIIQTQVACQNARQELGWPPRR